ncbi:MAG: cell wall-binding repeat-containing protein [Tetrasphaera sp.]|nr:cell wall-binding repeat-containing protein [Tetrasphaera sp.]
MPSISRRSALAGAAGVAVASTAVAPTVARAASPRLGAVVRWAGSDRYGGSALIAQLAFKPGVQRLFVASGEVFTDALSAAPIAARDKGPVLLANTNILRTTVLNAIAALTPETIVVLGGENSIGPGVADQLAQMAPTERWSGADRYSASAQMSSSSFDPGVATAYVASGLVFPDALSAAPVAGMTPGPILLSATNSLPSAIAAELSRLAPQNIVVLGGESTLSPALADSLSAYTTGTVTRWAGPDRFSTSAAISAANFPANVPTVFVASGRNFPDALAGAPVAGLRRAPMLLVDTDSIPDSIKAELLRLNPAKIIILGGDATVSKNVEAELAAYVRP